MEFRSILRELLEDYEKLPQDTEITESERIRRWAGPGRLGGVAWVVLGGVACEVWGCGLGLCVHTHLAYMSTQIFLRTHTQITCFAFKDTDAHNVLHSYTHFVFCTRTAHSYVRMCTYPHKFIHTYAHYNYVNTLVLRAHTHTHCSETFSQGRRRYYVDLRQNQRGRFVKVTMLAGGKTFIAIPGVCVCDMWCACGRDCDSEQADLVVSTCSFFICGERCTYRNVLRNSKYVSMKFRTASNHVHLNFPPLCSLANYIASNTLIHK